MPREYFHWSVLDKASEEDASLLPILRGHRGAYFFGGMAHDYPFYYCYGENPIIAETLHGHHGHDPLLQLVRLAVRISEVKERGQQQCLWAMFLGMLGHYVADSNMHPFVYFFTGDYYAATPEKRQVAVTKHRLLEVYLDIWSKRRRPLWNRGRYSPVKRELGAAFNLVCGILDEVFLEPGEQLWAESFNYTSYCQKLFFSAPVGAAVRVMKKRYPESDALSMFGRQKVNLDIFDSEIEFQNPASRQSLCMSVAQLEKKIVRELVEYFKIFKPAVLDGEKDIEAIASGLQGVSMDTGQADMTVQPRYFSQTGLPLPGLS